MRITDIRREASSSRRQRLLFDWTIAICSVVLLMSATSALADGNVPDDLLRSVDTAAEIDDDDRPRTTANNECGGRCACLGEYMDCANVQLSRFEERLPDWIRVLDLSHNELGDSVDQYIGNASKLTELKLRTNQVARFPVFRGLAALKVLQLAYNRIEVISAEALTALPSLVSLDLSKNLIKLVVQGSFPAVNKLRNLNLSFNRIEALDELALSYLKHLAELKLNQNRLRAIPVGLFRGMRKLRRMELNDNQIAELVYKTFANLTSLRALRMRGNRLRSLPTGVFHGLNNLDILELDNNQLTEIQKNGFFDLSTLTTVSLANNSITTIATNAWEFCQQLEAIDLANNRLTTITTHTFDCLSRLHTLNLRNNDIGIVTEGAFNCTAALDQLDLSANRVSYVVEDMAGPFRALQKLTRLDLADNRIKSVNRNAFLGLGQLQHLDLSSNNITSIQADAFARLGQLQTLALNTTALLCDCNLLPFHAWLSGGGPAGRLDAVRASCSYPASMRGRPLQSLDAGAFTCDDTPKPRIVEEPPAHLLAIRERNATLTCSATTSAATPGTSAAMTLKWKRDNVELAATAQVEREITVQPHTNGTIATARLRLVNVDDSHAGRYQCVVSNAYGTTYSSKVRVTVASFPKFLKTPGNLVINATSTARLDCAASGEPRPQISWEKDGGNDFPAARERRMHVMTEDDAFFIVNAKSTDQGVYTCTAENSAGAIKANTTLVVHEPPSFVKPMENREVPVGKSSVIECRALGSPRPTLRWHRGDNDSGVAIGVTERHFFAADGHVLIILDTEPSDAGRYSCTIANALGQKTDSMQLKVQTSAAAAAAAAAVADGPSGSLKTEEITALVIITIVCCAVATSVVWVVIIYQTRNRRGCCIGGTGGGGGANGRSAGSQSPVKGLASAGAVSLPDSLVVVNGSLLNSHVGVRLNGGTLGGRYESQSLLSNSGYRTPQIVSVHQLGGVGGINHNTSTTHSSSSNSSGCSPAAAARHNPGLAGAPLVAAYYDDDDDAASFKDSGRGDSTRRSRRATSASDVCCIELDDRTSPSVSYRMSPTAAGGDHSSTTATANTTATTTPSTEEVADATRHPSAQSLNGCSPAASLTRVNIQANRLSDLLIGSQKQPQLRPLLVQSYGDTGSTGSLHHRAQQQPMASAPSPTHTSSSSTRANSSLSDSIPQVPSLAATETPTTTH